MPTTARLAELAALVGDPSRAAMMMALMDGRALTATELAAAAGVTPQTASSHLQRLTGVGLLTVERRGRHRYHRLAGPAVAAMLEGLLAVSALAPGAGRPPRTGPRDEAMRCARTCYDHLAGRLAVAMADRMVARGELELSPDGGALTGRGTAFLHGMGIDLEAARGGRTRAFCRPCLDWSERRPHIAGAVGAGLRSACLAQGWIRQAAGARTVSVTPAGRLALDRLFELDAAVWSPAPHRA